MEVFLRTQGHMCLGCAACSLSIRTHPALAKTLHSANPELQHPSMLASVTPCRPPSDHGRNERGEPYYCNNSHQNYIWAGNEAELLN